MAHGSLEVIKAMVEIGNPNSVTDAGVAALCARTAVLGAFMNVKINASGYKDKGYTTDIIKQGEELERQAIAIEAEVIGLVNGKITP